MAQDFFHKVVKQALIKEGWTITHDPYELRTYNPNWQIDLGAERVIAATRDMEKIAIEIKSFRASSFANEFHTVLGQYLNYRSGLSRIESDRDLSLAVPIEVFEVEFRREGIANAISDYAVHLCIFDPVESMIIQWKK